MVSINTQNKLPKNVLWYMLLNTCIVTVVMIVFAVLISLLGTIHGTTRVNGGISTQTAFPAIILSVLIIISAIIILVVSLIKSILWYLTFSYIINNQSLTINSGFLFRQSRSIDFNKIQTINNTRGPLQIIFGLSTVNIWTASEDQLVISGRSRGAVARPDGRLYLSQLDADDVKKLITEKGSVQNVRNVA